MLFALVDFDADGGLVPPICMPRLLVLPITLELMLFAAGEVA